MIPLTTTFFFWEKENLLSFLEVTGFDSAHQDFLPIHGIDILYRKPQRFLFDLQFFKSI